MSHVEGSCIADGRPDNFAKSLCGRVIGKTAYEYDAKTAVGKQLLAPSEAIFNGIDQWFLNTFTNEPSPACSKCLLVVQQTIERDSNPN